MITKDKKTKAITKVQKHDKDTGSSAVQVSLLTENIESLVSHLKKHPKDNHSRKGLLGMVSRRQKTLKYLAKSDEKTYKEVLKKVGLKK